MPDRPSDVNKIAQAAAEIAQATTEIVVATQTAALQVLEAEMHALAQMLPGAEAAAAHPLPTDEEVEQGFENMPV